MCVSVCVSVCVSAFVSVCLSVIVSVSVSVCVCVSVCVSAFVSVCLSVWHSCRPATPFTPLPSPDSLTPFIDSLLGGVGTGMTRNWTKHSVTCCEMATRWPP